MMIPWVQRRSDDYDPGDADDEYWILARREESWQWFRLLEATRDPMSGHYSFLPFAGGWGDQPDWLIHDLTILGEYQQKIKEELRPGLVQNAPIGQLK